LNNTYGGGSARRERRPLARQRVKKSRRDLKGSRRQKRVV